MFILNVRLCDDDLSSQFVFSSEIMETECSDYINIYIYNEVLMCCCESYLQ